MVGQVTLDIINVELWLYSDTHLHKGQEHKTLNVEPFFFFFLFFFNVEL